jgi:hypothetical protein
VRTESSTTALLDKKVLDHNPPPPSFSQKYSMHDNTYFHHTKYGNKSLQFKQFLDAFYSSKVEDL